MKLHELTLSEAHAFLSKKEISSKDLTRAVLDRIDAVDEKIGAYITVSEETAMGQAEDADKRIGLGDTGPLTGIPMAIKDVMCTEGTVTTCGSKILENFVPPYDATVISKLKQAGAVIIGSSLAGCVS